MTTTTATTRDGARYTFAPDFSSVLVDGEDRALLTPPTVHVGFKMLLVFRDGGTKVTDNVAALA